MIISRTPFHSAITVRFMNTCRSLPMMPVFIYKLPSGWSRFNPSFGIGKAHSAVLGHCIYIYDTFLFKSLIMFISKASFI